MSGTSTLRICLAAMAPALTEAASARLKLQESTTKNDTLSLIKVDKKSDNEENFTLSKVDAVSVRNRSNVASHLLLNPKDEHTINGTCFDPKRLTPLGTTSPQIITIHTNISTFPSIKTLKLKVSHVDKFYSSGELVVKKEANTNQYFEVNKIMSQHQIAANKHTEQNKNSISIGEGGKLFNPSCIVNNKIVPSVMVNGDGELNRKADIEDCSSCDEKGNSFVKNGIQLNSELRSANLNSDSKSATSAAKMGINLKHDQMTHVIMASTLKSETESVVSEKSKEEMRKDCVKRQLHLERKVDILLRRLKRMKAKVVEAHSKEQLRYFIKFQHRNLQNAAKAIKNETPGPAELKEHFLSNEDVKNMSAAQLVKLVKNYQPNRLTVLEESVSSKLKLLSSNNVLMEPAVCLAALKTSERLVHRVQSASADLDSDATASSSGGESGDDEIRPSTSTKTIDLPPLIKRAEWKWVMDRAAVVSRWTWLQAQVSDLEYRIRQQSQIYRQLRSSKGGVVLGEPPSPVDILKRFQEMQPKSVGLHGNEKLGEGSAAIEVSNGNISTIISSVDKQASRLTPSLGNFLSSGTSLTGISAGLNKSCSVNGLTESPCSTSTDMAGLEESSSVPKELRINGKASESIDHSSLLDASCQSSRCRPLRSYRKRKILKTIGLYKTNSKAARLSDIRCRCYPPLSPCPICGGRYNNTLTADPDTMSLHERVALLDPSFHPVLSFPQDIHLSIHCEGLLKSGLLHSKPLPRRTRVSECKRQKVLSLMTEPVKKHNNGRQNGRNSATSVIKNFTTKIKQKYEGKTKSNVSSKSTTLKPSLNRVKRKKNKAARDILKRNQLEDDDDDLEAMYLESESSMSHKEYGLNCSSSQSSLKDSRDGHHRRRKVDNCFDINNIVIPLSMATSTRVEQPQYKEIVTPKWREITKTCPVDNKVVQSEMMAPAIEKAMPVVESMEEEEPIEDLSDDRYTARHLVLEQEEKKRFRNFVQYPPVRRNRARSDALSASSSGRLMSGGGGVSTEEGNYSFMEEGSSNPSTPLANKSLSTFFQNKNPDEHLENHQSNSRRRTVSISRRERSSSLLFDDVPNSPDDFSGIKPWPRRTFPISESEYQLMVKELTPNCEPVHHRGVTRRILEPSIYVGSSLENPEDVGNAPSPHPSNESLSSMGDDPNDPDWLDMAKRGKPQQTINDDINDPEWTGSDSPRKSKIKR